MLKNLRPPIMIKWNIEINSKGVFVKYLSLKLTMRSTMET